MKKLHAIVALAAVSVSGSAALGQLGRMTGADWSAGQMNPQRTSSVDSDPLIKPDTMTNGEFKLQWTWKPTGAPAHAATVAGITMQTGLAKPITMVSYGSTYFAAADNDTGDEYWTHKVAATAPPPACQSVSTISRPNDATVRPPTPQRQMPAAGPYISGVGAPGEGAPVELTRGGMFGPSAEYMAEAAAARAAGKPIPPAPPSNFPGGGGPGGPPPANADAARNAGPGNAGPGAAGPGGPGPGGDGAPPAVGLVNAPAAPGAAGGAARPAGAAAMPFRFNTPQGFYAVTPDGVLHTFGQNTAKDIVKPRPFLGAGAKVVDLITVNNMAYATVSGNCGGVAPGIYAIATGANASGDPVSLKTGADIIGGPAFMADGTIIIVVGPGGAEHANAVLAVDPKTLAVRNSFTIPGGAASSALVTKSDNKDVVAVASKDGRLYLLDPASLGGSDHKTPLAASDAFSKKPLSGSVKLVSWKDSAGTVWIAAPFAGGSPVSGGGEAGIVALKVAGSAEHPTLTPTWANGELNASVPPIVVTGVVFGVSGAKGGSPMLVALDGSTGKQLWSSGKTITSAVSSQPWYSLGQIYVAAADSTVYAFGFPMERY